MKSEKKIFLRSSGWLLLLMLLAGAVGSQCLAQTSGNVPIPEYYGTYAVAGGKLIDIGSSIWNENSTRMPAGVKTVQARIGWLGGKAIYGSFAYHICTEPSVAQVETYALPEMPSDVQFLVYGQASGMVSPMMVANELEVFAFRYLRNVQASSSACQFLGPAKTGLEAAWDLKFTFASVELRLKPMPNRQDIVVAVPSSSLTPGVYALTGIESGQARLGWFVFVVSPLSDAEVTNCRDVSFAFVQDKPTFTVCGNSPVASGSTSTIGAGTTPAPGTAQPSGTATVPPSVAPPPASMTCGEYFGCLKSGDTAVLSSQWNDALAFYQKASTLEPSKPLAWTRIASVYLATGRQQEAPAMWDKALSLGGPVLFTVCQQRGLSSCEKGDLLLGPKEVSFTTTTGQKLFTISPSEVNSVGAHKVFTSMYLRFSINGKNYNFDYFPTGVECEVRSLVTCPPQGRAQQAAVDDYVSAAVPKLASGALGSSPAATSGTSATNAPSSSTSANLQLAEQVRKVIASYETPNFHSPLDDEQSLQSIISESQASGVSLWLLFGQAKFETTFGDPINATVRDGMTFTDGSTGNAHNVFNIRPGTSWAGRVLDTGRGGMFRVYASYEDSVRDYLSLMSSNLYWGKSLDSLINTYFPPGENGPARVEEYITSVIQTANKLGFTVDRNTVPVP